MKRVLSVLLGLTVLGGGGYWYHTAHSTCRVPIFYDFGTLDERFDMSEEQVRAAVSESESLWEDATGKNLFTYQEGASFLVNFIYDDRQEVTNEEQGLREVLNEKENVSESIRDQYESLVDEYNDLKDRYEKRVDAYENKLATHNGEVAHWNSEGGAPEEVYERLNATQAELADEREELNRLVKELNQLVAGINTLGERGNETVRDYNENVEEYNDRFNHEREFTQGDYRGTEINIYQFEDAEELRLVLAHELGHALSLGHVDDPQSVMYFLMEGQLAGLNLSEADLAEFARVCGK